MVETINSLLPATLTALDALALNQQMLATNIANASSEGFKPSYLNFEAYMTSVLSEDGEVAVDQVDMAQYVNKADREVQLDLELGLMSENLQKYKAIMDILNRQTSLMQLVITSRSA